MRVRNISGEPLVLRLSKAFPPAVPAGAVTDIPAEVAESVLCQPWYWEAADDEAWAVVAAHLAAVKAADDAATKAWKAVHASVRGEPPAPTPTWWDHGQVEALIAAGGTVAARSAPKTEKES